jgi:hypothetical protein
MFLWVVLICSLMLGTNISEAHTTSTFRVKVYMVQMV